MIGFDLLKYRIEKFKVDYAYFSETTKKPSQSQSRNEVYIKVGSDTGTAQEISDYFTFWCWRKVYASVSQ